MFSESWTPSTCASLPTFSLMDEYANKSNLKLRFIHLKLLDYLFKTNYNTQLGNSQFSSVFVCMYVSATIF